MNIKDFWKHVDIRGLDDCWEWKEGKNSNGYGVVNLDTGRQEKAHRVAYKLQHTNPGELKVCHSCDNPPCCNPSHLFLGTQNENLQDMTRKGRRGKTGRKKGTQTGEKNNNSKLTEKKVSLIKSFLRAGGKVTAIARQFRVTHSTISQIKTKKIWKEV